MPFYDCNLSNSGLEKRALALGWTRTGRAKVVEASDPIYLRKAAGKAPLINCLAVRDFYKDDALVRAIAESKPASAFEIPLYPIIRSQGIQRAVLLRRLRGFVRKCLKLKARVLITSRAQSESDLKSPRDAIAIAQLLGFSKEQAQSVLERSVLE